MAHDEIAISVQHVSKTFRLPHEKNTSIKSAVVNFASRKKGYELQTALNDVSFEIKKGEFFGIVGRNGSGKSTLLKMLAGIYNPSKGTIQVNGKLTPFIELGVGFNPELTGRENVFLNGALLGFNRQEMTAMYEDIVRFAELGRFMDQKLKNYSSGMQVRLAFSIAIRARSDILLIDEVLAVGDASFQDKCFAYFRKLKKEKRTVVFVSHDMGTVQEFCDRALLIDSGNLKLTGKTQEIASRYLLNAAEQSTENTVPDEVTPPKDVIEFLDVTMDRKPAVYGPDDTVRFTINYKLKTQLKHRLGISIQKNDISIHERNTKDIVLPSRAGRHSVAWEAPARTLVQGLHKVNVAAFTHEDFKLLTYLNEATSFMIERDEETIAGLMDMNSNWRQK